MCTSLAYKGKGKVSKNATDKNYQIIKCINMPK